MRKTSGSSFFMQHSVPYSLLIAFLAVISGGLVYVFFRPGEPLFFTWADEIGAGNLLPHIRRFTLPLIDFIPNWILFSMSSGLWAFAYALIIASIWSGSKSGLRFFWFATIPILVFGYELLQLTDILPGTFCLLDLAFGLAGIIIGIRIGFNKFRRRK
jgi:hypothetical protein